MVTRRSSRASGRGRVLRKSLVSGFVVASYVAYALHERFGVPSQAVATLPSSPQPSQGAPLAPSSEQDQGAQLPEQDQAVSALPQQNPVPPTATPDVTTGSQFKNGTFTGASADAFYGQVQVQVVIQNGKIATVTFLNYPKDRRTSAYINSIATPWLQSEAIQAQSAQVDLISGATLTSEAFMASLQSALDRARG